MFYISGYVTRNLEKQGIATDRCELNRQIMADNKLLRELKTMLQKLTKGAAYSVERIAQTLEAIRDKIVLAEYQLIFNGRRTREYEKAADSVRLVPAEIREVGQQIRAKRAERKTAQAEKQACGILHPVRLHQLTGQIAALGEEIEELREKKSMLLASLDCHNDADAKAIADRLKVIEENFTRLAAQREKLAALRDDCIAEFENVRSEIQPEDIPAVLDKRIDLRNDDDALAGRLREVYGGVYDYYDLIYAGSRTDAAIHEESNEIGVQAINREYARRHPQTERNHHRQKQDFEMSL